MKIALCGNPNVGKTTIFNRLTHSDAPVGNWHGVTVDVSTKRVRKTDYITDLPGAYSLTARTAEERVTCEQILYGDYDVAVYVAEVNNLRRNLYMFMQIAEAGKKAALVVNMMDEARGKVDLELLSARLGVPVIGTSSKAENPRAAILQAASRAARSAPVQLKYLTEPRMAKRACELKPLAEKAGLTPIFAALKTTERDGDVMERLGLKTECGTASCEACAGCMQDGITDLPATLRYAYIDEALNGVIAPHTISARARKADKILLGKAALPIFFAVMAAVFVITIEAGGALSDLLTGAIMLLTEPVGAADMPPWAISLICDGVISGVGAVIAFLPQVVILYLLTAILQDSGYMSRVAFVTDDFFKKIGLSGRAAFSVILGLGCSATAVLTTRGIAGEDARRRAAFITPFCPCSARLAVFTAITAYFGLSGIAVAAMYALGFVAAIAVLKITAAVKRRNSDVSADDAFIMEMPPYRLPQAKRVASVVWRNALSFVSRVGSVVLCVSVIMWVLCNFSIAQGFTGGDEASIMHTFAELIAPIFTPIGFGNWRAVTALISGVAAKETVISVIASLGGMSEVFGTATAATSFMIFVCLYVPCVATVSAIAKENGGKSAVASVATHTVVAYVASLIYYQSATLFAARPTAFIIVWTCVAAAVAIGATITAVKRVRTKKRAA